MIVENKILPKNILNLYKDLLDSSYQKVSSKEKKIILKSLVIAFNGHDGQLQKSGEPFNLMRNIPIEADEIEDLMNAKS